MELSDDNSFAKSPRWSNWPFKERTWGLFRVGAESYAKRFSSAFWPPVFAGEENVCPSEGRDVGENICRGALAFLFSFGCGLTEVEGVPMDNDGCKQV